MMKVVIALALTVALAAAERSWSFNGQDFSVSCLQLFCQAVKRQRHATITCILLVIPLSTTM
jgi:hypothetical protein